MFAGYTNAALVRFATIPKVHTIAHANMDSREMDENVKVVVRSINNYVVLQLQIIHKGMVTYISILLARKCIVKLNAGRDIYGREHIEKFFSSSPKCFCIYWNQSTHYCFLGSFILCWTDCCMATETYLMFSTTNINAVQIKYEYHVMLLIF